MPQQRIFDIFKAAIPGDSRTCSLEYNQWAFCYAMHGPAEMYMERKNKSKSGLYSLLPSPNIRDSVNNPSLPGLIIHHSVSIQPPLLPGRSHVEFNKLNKSYFL